MEQMNFHKQKLYSLVAAGLAFISLILPWVSIDVMGFSNSINGFRSWGILSLLGVLAVAGFTLLGDKTQEYNNEFKRYVMIAFGAIALGAVLFFIRKNSMAGGAFFGSAVKTGIGVWICLIAGLAGFALVYGLIKISSSKKTVEP